MVGLLCKRIASILAVGVVVGFSTTSVASAGQEPLPTAEEVIKGCWAISEDLRNSPNTNAMRAGNLDTALCLEEAIIKHSSEFIDPDYQSEENVTKIMKELRAIFGSFYWSLYNEHKGCNPSCGTLFHPVHNTMTALIYEKMLEHVLHQRHLYNHIR